MSNARDLSILGNAPAFSAFLSTQQSFTSAVYAKVNLNSEDFDTHNTFASGRFTPTVAGYYQINAAVYASCSSGGVTALASVYKNGTAYQIGSFGAMNSATNALSSVSFVIFMNGTTDYLELFAYIAGTNPIIPAPTSGLTTRMSGFLVSAT